MSSLAALLGIDRKGQGWKWEDQFEGSWNNKVSSDRGLNLTGTGGCFSSGWIVDILKVEDTGLANRLLVE